MDDTGRSFARSGPPPTWLIPGSLAKEPLGLHRGCRNVTGIPQIDVFDVRQLLARRKLARRL